MLAIQVEVMVDVGVEVVEVLKECPNRAIQARRKFVVAASRFLKSWRNNKEVPIRRGAWRKHSRGFAARIEVENVVYNHRQMGAACNNSAQ